MKDTDTDYKMINLGSKIIKELDYRLFNVMSLVKVGIIIIKFLEDNFKVVYANNNFIEKIGVNIIGFDQEKLEDIVVEEDISNFGDIVYPPIDESSPDRIIRIKAKDSILFFTMKSRSVVIKNIDGIVSNDAYVVNPGEYVQIIATEYNLSPKSLMDCSSKLIIEFLITSRMDDFETLMKSNDVLYTVDMINTIEWNISYANTKAIKAGLVDINYTESTIIKYSLKNDIINMTNIIANLLRKDTKVIVCPYVLKDIYGKEVDGMAVHKIEHRTDIQSDILPGLLVMRIDIDVEKSSGFLRV